MPKYPLNVFAGCSTSIAERNQFAQTPEDFYALLDEEFDFNWDPCPKKPKFDGLKVPWGNSTYVNPPYNDIEPWIKKAYEESLKGKTVVMLLPARTMRKWFHEYALKASEIRWLQGGLRFEGYKKKSPFGLMIVVFRG